MYLSSWIIRKMKAIKESSKSIIAFARKLSRIIYVMLKTRTEFDERKMFRGEYDAVFLING